ncbi:GNAT family N-acetyltransferase [Alteribacter natronophilus]|uniref:GNAT family N-acetyltransferase n=1 Tax=Alteribacter natronophilus TaxID=2583810 RepID=UPI00110F16EB|nr:GNAT family N-acetyltransferase [Alteribacter natronophilus]TMW70371.1 GNAT family N-acetyltransferase [Alteribacter natronophilus]
MDIVVLTREDERFEEAVQVFWREWGNESNYKFYKDCMIHSCMTPDDLPLFYMAVEENKIIGTAALIRNDLNSRQDLCPWLACLFVDKEHRGKQIGSQLLNYGLKLAADLGCQKLYLTSDLENYYERYGWMRNGVAYGVSGEDIKIYEKVTGQPRYEIIR